MNIKINTTLWGHFVKWTATLSTNPKTPSQQPYSNLNYSALFRSRRCADSATRRVDHIHEIQDIHGHISCLYLTMKGYMNILQAMLPRPSTQVHNHFSASLNHVQGPSFFDTRLNDRVKSLCASFGWRKPNSSALIRTNTKTSTQNPPEFGDYPW